MADDEDGLEMEVDETKARGEREREGGRKKTRARMDVWETDSPC